MKKIYAALCAMILFSACAEKIDFAPKISLFSGNVTVNGKSAVTGTPIVAGDKIITGDNSFCEIQMNNKSVIRLGLKTELIFRISETENILDLRKGWLSGVTRKIFTRQGTYLIKSNSVVASVRGTSFCVKTEDDHNVYFCVCNGKIELADPDGKQRELISASHHAALRFTRNNNGSINLDKNPGLQYHNDENINILARSINEKIDWTTVDSH